ncbi:MAG: hypothetical protein JO304_13765 [Solirubrobacterales bacterium]|jgi:hypothetical protein|nr:hypothetical protein [Solirubrobacterales bacterium]
MERQAPETQNVKTNEGPGSTRALPDNRVLVTLDDGRSLVIDGDRLKPLRDGTYKLVLTRADPLTAG